MRLHAIDEFPFHQHPAPFNIAATSDPHYRYQHVKFGAIVNDMLRYTQVCREPYRFI
jgi:hypothetical protein